MDTTAKHLLKTLFDNVNVTETTDPQLHIALHQHQNKINFGCE
jgi:hypothetical protein